MNKLIFNNAFSFTLIELLIAMAIMSILASTVIIALNPTKQINDALNSSRLTDVQSILSAIQQYAIDNKGDMPSGITAGGDERQLGTALTGCTISTGGCSVTNDVCLNLTSDLAKYIKSIPKDPKDGTDSITKYSVVVDINGIMTVKACGGPSSPDTPISVSR